MLRRWVRIGGAAGLLGAALTVAVLLVLPRAGHAVTCTDVWVAQSGNWGTPANWSKGAPPGDGDDACITTTGTYTVTLSSNSTTGVNTLTLGGASGTQTLVIGSGMTFYGAITINATGVLTLGDGGNGDTRLTCIGTCISSLDNAGLLKTVAGGGGNRNIDDNVTNGAGGTIDYGAVQSAQTGGLCGNTNRGLTNNGTVLIEPSSQLLVNCASLANQTGMLTNNGSVWINASRFVQRGGSVSGNAVVLSNGGVLDDDTGGSGGSFTFIGGPNPSTGNPNRLTGTDSSPGVAPNQTVTISSGASIQVDGVSNAGTILVGDSGIGGSTLYCYGGCLSTLTNTTGTLRTVAGGGGTRVFDGVNLNNQAGGTLDYAALTVQGGGLCGNTGRGVTNNGTAVIETTGHLVINCGSYVQGSGGTFKTTINGTTSAFGQLSNGSVALDGKLQVTTIGSPAKDSTWPIISNATRSGTFASWDLRSTNYWQHYLVDGLTLVAEGTCNTWIGGVDNLFHTANNWSFGVSPVSTDDACITATTSTTPPAAADTYGVRADNNPTIHSLTVGGTSGTQTLIIPSSFTLNITADSATSPHGVVQLGDAGAGASALGCQGASCTANGPTLANAGALNTVQGTGDVRHIQMVLVTNMAGGSMDIAGNTSLTGGCQPGGGIANTRGLYNNGTVTVEAGGVLQALCGLTNTGTVANHGAVQMGGDEFVQRGTETGNPVIFAGGSGLDPDTASGPGSFLFLESGGIRPSGSHPGIAAGDTVTIASTNTTVQVAPPITNAGTIVLGDGSGSGDSSLCCEYFTAPATITNTGTLRTVQGGGGIRHLGVNVANAAGGMVDIATDTRQESSQSPSCGLNGNNATWMTNKGTFTIEVGRHYTLTNCGSGSLHQETFNQGSSGTLQTTIDVGAPPAAVMTGGAVNLGGALKVTTIGSPAVGSQWPIISGATVAGGFTTFDFGGVPYAWHYPGDGITLMRMGLNPCRMMGQGWGCLLILPTPPPSPHDTWRSHH